MREARFLRFTTTLFELTKIALVIVILLVAFVVLVGTPLLVRGESMLPNFHNGEVVIVEHVSYSGAKQIVRGDVVAARFPADPANTKLIKRVIGLPGETVTVQDSHFFINGQALTEPYQPKFGLAPYDEIPSLKLGADEYFLAGDNRPGSSDSRLWGPATRSDILGRVSFVIFPPANIQFVDRAAYPN